MPNAQLPPFSSEDVELILAALNALRGVLQELRRGGEAPLARMQGERSLDTLGSAAAKLKKRETDFTLEECGYLYLALSEYKEGLNSTLDELAVSAPHRGEVQDCLRASNQLLRRLRACFAALELDPEEMLARLRGTL